MASVARIVMLLTLVGLLGLGLGLGLGPAQAPAFAEQDWQPGPDASGDNTLVGTIDAPASGASLPSSGKVLITGWVVDTTAQGWAGIDQVQIFNGLAGQGGSLLAKATVAQRRPDVAGSLGNPFWTNSGFSVVLPTAGLPGGPLALGVYAHTPGKGWWYRQVNVNVARLVVPSDPMVVITAPANDDQVGQGDRFLIKGYAIDRNAPEGSGVDKVEAFLSKAELVPNPAPLGTAELGQPSGSTAGYWGAQFNNAGWQLWFDPSHFHGGVYQLVVFAHSAVSGKQTVAQVTFNIAEPPIPGVPMPDPDMGRH
jgi:hypothetical protein